MTEVVATMPQVTVATALRHLHPPPNTEALLFDLDGTLVDSAIANLASYNAALCGTGVTVSSSWFEKRFGLPSPEVFAQIARAWRLVLDLDTCVARKNQAYLDLIPTIEVYPHMEALLEITKDLPVGVVTSGPRLTAATVLESTGLSSFVDVLVTRDDVSSAKPSPEGFLSAADLLGVAPERCLVYEDSLEGRQAATRAGMSAVDVGPLHRRGRPS